MWIETTFKLTSVTNNVGTHIFTSRLSSGTFGYALIHHSD